MIEKCIKCPSQCDGCLSIESGHSRFCQLADKSHPDFDPEIVDVMANWCEGKPLDAPRAESAVLAIQSVSVLPDLPINDMDINRAIVRCPHRVKPACGCPDNPHTCTHPGRAGEKWWLDCYQCKVAEIRAG